jgi:hypothetical protein
MEGFLSRDIPPTFRISTHTNRPSSKSILNKVYTFEEIVSSVQTAVELRDNIDYTDPISLEKAWKLVHILTSDSAWGVGMGSLVDEYLKTETRVFMRGLLEHTSEYLDLFSVANFMTHYFQRMKDPGFMRLLRAYLLAFPETFDTASTLMGLKIYIFSRCGQLDVLQPDGYDGNVVSSTSKCSAYTSTSWCFYGESVHEW